LVCLCLARYCEESASGAIDEMDAGNIQTKTAAAYQPIRMTIGVIRILQAAACPRILLMMGVIRTLRAAAHLARKTR
jgi:hypothetical protein